MLNLRRLLLALMGAAGVTWLFTACPVVSGQDNFICGVRGVGDAVNRCDAPGERCICSDHRCALPEPQQCPSGWRYSFPSDDAGDDPECVPREVAQNYVLANSSNPLCPGEAELEQECGGFGSDGGVIRCTGPQQFCLCTVRRCAEPAPDCADAGVGARFVSTRTCIGPVENLASVRDRADGTCPGTRLDDLFDAGP